MTFGDSATARRLYDHVVVNNRVIAPPGFKKIGQGCYRAVYLEEDSGLVYKIGSYGANVDEAANARRLLKKSQRNLPFEVFIPRTRTFPMPSNHGYPECVAVQEFAANAKTTDCDAEETWRSPTPSCNCGPRRHPSLPCFANVLETLIDWSNLDDIHNENVLYQPDLLRFAIVDLAC